MLGGDTDTNGAIVGGLVGAVVGFKNLPIEYLEMQFKVDISQIKS
jgi:ADP-ribosylglycohydrolase